MDYKKDTIERIQLEGQDFARALPPAAGLSEGLAKLSYNFEQAIAELIDNSLTAGATKIKVEINLRITKKVYVCIIDNGCGISREDLPSAITYGSTLRKPGPSLSIYGFGMKTAMQSFTSKFCLVSKPTAQEKSSMITFDQELIKRTNDYLYAIGEPIDEYSKLLKEFTTNQQGTLVVTEDANHFFPLDDYPEEKRLKFIKQKVDLLRKHIAMTYQRFLNFSDNRAPNVEIFVDGEPVQAWDPFCLSEGIAPESTKNLPLRSKDGKEGVLILNAYLLPKAEQFSSREAYDKADVGPSTHGFYVYRENRLLDHATYFDIVRRDTHYQLLRIDMSYESSLDDLFNPALNKNRAFLGSLRDLIEEWLRPLLREADRRSREQVAGRPTKGIHDPSQKKIQSVMGSIEKAKITAITETTARVENKWGVVELPIRSEHTNSKEKILVSPVESILNTILWEMRLIDGEQAVALNKSHEFYQRFYLNAQGAAAYAVDAIFWALAITEAQCTIKEHSDQLEDFRFQVSRALHKLAQRMPEVSALDDSTSSDE